MRPMGPASSRLMERILPNSTHPLRGHHRARLSIFRILHRGHRERDTEVTEQTELDISLSDGNRLRHVDVGWPLAARHICPSGPFQHAARRQAAALMEEDAGQSCVLLSVLRVHLRALCVKNSSK